MCCSQALLIHNRCVDNRPPRAAVDPGAALWIAPRLSGQFGAVTRTVPARFAAYARIFHPADPGTAVHRRWSEVAAANGRIMHPVAQYARISTPASGRTEPAPLAGIQAPATGDLEPACLRSVCEILARHTPAPVTVLVCRVGGMGRSARKRARCLLRPRRPSAAGTTGAGGMATRPSRAEVRASPPRLLPVHRTSRRCSQDRHVGEPRLVLAPVPEHFLARRQKLVHRQRDRLRLHHRGRYDGPHRRCPSPRRPRGVARRTGRFPGLGRRHHQPAVTGDTPGPAATAVIRQPVTDRDRRPLA